MVRIRFYKRLIFERKINYEKTTSTTNKSENKITRSARGNSEAHGQKARSKDRAHEACE